MTQRRLVFAILVLAIAAMLGTMAVVTQMRRAAAPQVDPAAGIGGPFTMVAARDGRTVTQKNLLGHPSLVFFGFTSCTDVCPATLTQIASWLDALGSDGKSLKVYFVTVDPARDTPDKMARYIAKFSDRITGLTGTPQQVRTIADAYRVHYKKVPLANGDYDMVHSAAIFLMDSKGKLFDAITYETPTDQALAKLRALIAAS